MKLRSLQFIGLVAITFVGCRAPTSTSEQKHPLVGSAPPPPAAAQALSGVEEGSYSIPQFAGGPNGNVGASAVAQASASSKPGPCAAEPPATAKRGWRAWLPTKDHSNDPRRERGQFADGWYEPEYRGMSD